jgi:curved DNA-binding protein CbpA
LAEKPMNPTLAESYKLLGLTPDASDDEITRAFKQLALKYHPDKNRDKIEWANAIMAKINNAYSIVMGQRFEKSNVDEREAEEMLMREQERVYAEKYAREKSREMLRERYIQEFVAARENVKDSIYQYYQFGLHNLTRRDSLSNKTTFNNMVKVIRHSFHTIQAIAKKTDEEDIVEHLNVFNKMVFTFYRACECLNILDSYSNILDVEAYRLYREGDERLHKGQKEVFYERHNRGKFNQEMAVENIMASIIYFNKCMQKYPGSSWAVETKIKLEHAEALQRYVLLFFNEDE